MTVPVFDRCLETVSQAHRFAGLVGAPNSTARTAPFTDDSHTHVADKHRRFIRHLNARLGADLNEFRYGGPAIGLAVSKKCPAAERSRTPRRQTAFNDRLRSTSPSGTSTSRPSRSSPATASSLITPG